MDRKLTGVLLAVLAALLCGCQSGPQYKVTGIDMETGTLRAGKLYELNAVVAGGDVVDHQGTNWRVDGGLLYEEKDVYKGKVNQDVFGRNKVTMAATTIWWSAPRDPGTANITVAYEDSEPFTIEVTVGEE